jgi:eukaryotic-like serine/threonine-protein kinase
LAHPLTELQATLAGRYRFERELGRGGMATVFLATDLKHSRLVALKVLRPEVSASLGGERFAREIAIAARLSHAHILPLYDSGTLEAPGAAPVLFYTMPYVDGHSLRDRLHEQSPLPVAEAIAIAGQVADALDYAHREGIVHRDIKPENILLAAGGALVADFGIARALESAGEARLTQTGLALGTPAYMSPEQASASSKLDGRADVYALGCVLYEMLAGGPPFTGTTAQAVMARHAMDPVPSLRTVNPMVSPALSRAVKRALAKVPGDRFPTAAAFADALAALGTIRTDESDAGVGRRKLGAAAALSVVALAVVLALMLHARPAPQVAADPAVIAVAPFRVDAADPELAYLREGLVDLLATKLGGTIAVRPVDSRTLLSAWRESAPGTNGLSRDRVLTVATRLGAGQVIDGEVTEVGSRVTLSATLRRVEDSGEMTRVKLEGSADSVGQLVDQLAARLLARAAGEPEERLPALAATSAAALRAYLDGWAVMRRGSLGDALKQFQRALAADSTFALAALAATRVLLDGPFDRSDPEAQLAWRLRDRLTPGDRAYLLAMVGPRFPEASGLLDRRQAVQRLVRLSPENADGWNMYTFLMCYEQGDVPITAEQCRAASRRASALDSTNTMTLGIANGFADMFDDTTSLKRTLRLYMRLDSVSPNSRWIQWRAATFLGDTVTARRLALSDSMVSTAASMSLGPVWDMAVYYLHEGRGLGDVEAALQRTLVIAPTGSQRGSVAGMQYELALARGRATNLPEPYPLSDWSKVLSALFAGADPGAAAAAAAALERQVGSPVTDGCCLERFATAEWALEGGRLATARRALADMERYPSSPEGRAAGRGGPRVWALIVAAQIAARDGSRDGSSAAAERLRQLDSALVDRPDEQGPAWMYGNLIAARLHERRGEYAAALAAITREREDYAEPVVVTYHREVGRIAALAGDTATAIRAYQRYLRIRTDAEPRLQPEVQQVKVALAALEQATTVP